MKKQIIVISQRGVLVGTQVLDPEEAGKGVYARLMAGPKQKLHQIEMDVPENHHARENVAAWHKSVKKKLKLK